MLALASLPSRPMVLLSAICLGWITSTAAAEPLLLTAPAAPSVQVVQGEPFDIEWTGGAPDLTLDLRHSLEGTGQWLSITAGIPSVDGKYTWDTTGVALGFHDIGGTGWYGGDAGMMLTPPPGRLEVVPEPASLALLGAFAPLLLRFRRRRTT